MKLRSLILSATIGASLLFVQTASADTLMASRTYTAPGCSWIRILTLPGQTIDGLRCNGDNVGSRLEMWSNCFVSTVHANYYSVGGAQGKRCSQDNSWAFWRR